MEIIIFPVVILVILGLFLNGLYKMVTALAQGRQPDDGFMVVIGYLLFLCNLYPFVLIAKAYGFWGGALYLGCSYLAFLHVILPWIGALRRSDLPDKGKRDEKAKAPHNPQGINRR